MNFKYWLKVLSFWNMFQTAKKIYIFFQISILAFIALTHSQFESSWRCLTTTAHKKMWLMKTKISGTQGIAPICVDI